MTSLHAQIRKTKHFVPNWTLKGMENDTPANQTKCFSLHCSQPNKDVKATDVLHSHLLDMFMASSNPPSTSNVRPRQGSKMPKPPWFQFIDLARSWSEKTLLTDGFLLESSPWHNLNLDWVLIHLIHLTSCSGFSFFKVLHILTRATEKKLLIYFYHFFLRFGFSLRY